MRAATDKRESEIYPSEKKLIPSMSILLLDLCSILPKGIKEKHICIAFTNTDPELVLFFARWIVLFLSFLNKTSYSAPSI